MRHVLLLAGLALCAANLAALGQRAGAFDQSINHPAIRYNTTDSTTAVDALNRKLRDGSAKLVYEEKTGYLRSVLAHCRSRSSRRSWSTPRPASRRAT